MPTDLKVPSAGESVSTVQIGEWRKREGDFVRADETIVELETDKASMDLPSPVSGKIAKLLAKQGATVKVGDVIAQIDESATATSTVDGHNPAGGGTKFNAGERADQSRTPAPASDGAAKGDGANTATKPAASGAASGGSAGFVMPAARRLAGENALDPGAVAGTGVSGRVTKEDVQQRLDAGGAQGKQSAHGEARVPHPIAASDGSAPPMASSRLGVGDNTRSGDRHEEAVPMTALRRKIAERLVQAQQNAALLTTFNEIDMSAVLELRRQRNEAFEKRYGVKMGFMSFFVKAAIDALKQFPQVNAEIRGTDIVFKNYYDIGVAVSTERGLVVPVVRNAERLSFAEIENTIAALAARARDGKLALEDLQGGTFTISNGGVFGSLMSTPIVNPPQSAILGLHAIQDRPVAREGQVVIRPMMYVALTYDHRVIDGRESVSFLKRVKECVEEPARMLLEV